MNKCIWEDGKLNRCNDLNNAYNGNYIYDTHNTIKLVSAYNNNEFITLSFCPFCGADIRKPDPIIKKSGETWVARYEDVDYLWICKNGVSDPLLINTNSIKNPLLWKPISEIEITDEIAKLRPMVVGKYYDSIAKLLYQNKSLGDRNCVILEKTGVINCTGLTRLATIEELED